MCVSSDKIDDDLEMTMVCHRPEGLEQLEAQTNFSKRELQVLYRGFKNVSDWMTFGRKSQLVRLKGSGAHQKKKYNVTHNVSNNGKENNNE